MKRLTFHFLALWALALLAAPVAAQPAQGTSSQAGASASGTAGTNGAAVTNHEDEAARLLFNTAREAFAAGNYEVALQRFQQAYDLSHRPQLLYNIGTTLDRLRRDRDAVAAFERFLAESDPTSPNRTEVEARVRVLRQAIDEEDRQRAEAAAQARAHQEELARAQAEAETQAAAAREAQQQAAADRASGISPVLFYSLAGAAVALGGVGIGLGIRTKNLNDDYEALAASGAPVDQVQSAYDDAKSSQTLTNAMLFSAAGLAVGAGVTAIFTRWHRAPDASASRPTTTAGFSPQRGGFVLGLDHRF